MDSNFCDFHDINGDAIHSFSKALARRPKISGVDPNISEVNPGYFEQDARMSEAPNSRDF